MDQLRALLAQPRLSVVSAEPDPTLDATARTITPSVRIGGPGELAALLAALLAVGEPADRGAPRSLDLFGHSTAHTAQLRLGDWVIDAAEPGVAAFFGELAAHDVLPRLGIARVRLLACRTADTEAGRATICRLADILGVDVLGTRHLLYDAHHDAHGFLDQWGFLLVGARELRPAPPGPRGPRRLVVAELPATAPDPAARAVPAGALVACLRGDAGAPLPGAAAIAALALEVPAGVHVAHVVHAGGFVRFYPDGAGAPGVAYPVDDAAALDRLMARPA